MEYGCVVLSQSREDSCSPKDSSQAATTESFSKVAAGLSRYFKDIIITLSTRSELVTFVDLHNMLLDYEFLHKEFDSASLSLLKAFCPLHHLPTTPKKWVTISLLVKVETFKVGDVIDTTITTSPLTMLTLHDHGFHHNQKFNANSIPFGIIR
ncbi:unnamed protein product [Dovyalis caffra]|uniref:Uncharacterized protein n=1 Tax=Dovyalis caffra TaxID=77055 RepID=A0AAV1RRL2_9ROSI|nr:unnamed protein product [Dovyalis caffra]